MGICFQLITFKPIQFPIILEKTWEKYISTYSLHQILTYLNIQYLSKSWRQEWKLQVLGHLLRNIANIISVAVNTVVLYKKEKIFQNQTNTYCWLWQIQHKYG